MPQNAFIFMPARELWPAASVNARLPPPNTDSEGKPIPASTWLAVHRPVEQMTWAPGKPTLVPDKLIADGGWIDRPGCTVFNLYKPPIIKPTAGDVCPWLDLVQKNYPDEADRVVAFLAHRVQRPDEKINHGLVLGGAVGTGKDTILEPVKQAIGPWNFAEVSPKQVFGRFNGFLKSVILRVSEARDLGDYDRYAFHDHMKVYIAAPPDVLRVDKKNIREYYVPNLCGVIITTNHKTDGIYLPPDDRRHYVLWSNLCKENFASDYFNNLYRWYENGGNAYVAYYLANLDISGFGPKAPPPKTQAFWEIAGSTPGVRQRPGWYARMADRALSRDTRVARFISFDATAARNHPRTHHQFRRQAAIWADHASNDRRRPRPQVCDASASASLPRNNAGPFSMGHGFAACRNRPYRRRRRPGASKELGHPCVDRRGSRCLRAALAARHTPARVARPVALHRSSSRRCRSARTPACPQWRCNDQDREDRN